MPDDAGYSSSISGDRPDESARIRRLIDETEVPPPLWDDVPTPDGPPITAPWPGLFAAISAEGYPEPEDRGDAVLSPQGRIEYVEDLIRPGRILVHAATEGSGKSFAECELGVRIAVAGGSFAGTWPILQHGPVVVMSEMHEDDDYIREDLVLSALGLQRSDLRGRYYRLPLLTAAGGPPALMVAEWRDWITRWLRDHEALLLIVDTATVATQVKPWGEDMQAVYAGLRMMLDQYPALSIVLVVHLRKPMGTGHRDINAVMGEWARWCDVVLLQENEGQSLERARLTTHKRVARQRRISVTKLGGLLIDPVEVESESPPQTRVPYEAVADAIRDHPGITYAGLAEKLNVSKVTAYRYVKSLGERVESRPEGLKNAEMLYLTASPLQTVSQAQETEQAETPATHRFTASRTYIREAVKDAVPETVDEEPAPTPIRGKAEWLRPCRHFVAHQSHHRQTREGWVCDACDQAAA